MPKAFVNGINLNYKVDGQGEPLVLIMGIAGSRQGWIFQKHVYRRYFQVITFDNRGVGRSDKPSGPYSMRMMADDTVGLMDYLGIEKAHILGVSMGGMIAQELAINYPERVKKLVLGCTFAREDETGGHTSEYFKGLGVGKDCSDDELRRVSAKRVLTTDFSLAFNNRPYRMILTPLSWVYARLLPTKGIRAQFEAIVDHDTLDRLHKIEAPTLVITGTQDRIIRPSSTEVIANRITNAKLVKVDGGPHALFVAMKGRFNREVLDFLREGGFITLE